MGGFGQGLTSMVVLVTDQTGRDFNYRSVHGPPELFYQDHLVLGGEGQDPHHTLGVGALGEFPVIALVEPQIPSFSNGFG